MSYISKVSKDGLRLRSSWFQAKSPWLSLHHSCLQEATVFQYTDWLKSTVRYYRRVLILFCVLVWSLVKFINSFLVLCFQIIQRNTEFQLEASENKDATFSHSSSQTPWKLFKESSEAPGLKKKRKGKKPCIIII